MHIARPGRQVNEKAQLQVSMLFLDTGVYFIGRIFAGRCRLSLPKPVRSWRSETSDLWLGALDAYCCICEVAVSQRLSGGLSV